MKENFIKIICLFLLSIVSSMVMSQTTVTKTYGGSTISIDGETTILPGITFDASDFPNGCVIENVSVSVTWRKVDRTCANPKVNNSFAFHTETAFDVSGPGGTIELAAPDTWTGGDYMSSFITTEFSDGFPAPGGGTPVGGTFSPSDDLSFYNGTSPIGTWNLIGIDTAAEDPLCINSYTITITTTDIDANAGSDQLICVDNSTLQTSVTLSALPSGTGYTYDWDVAGVPDVREPTFTHTMTSNANENVDYTVTVTDANGCTDTDVVTVRYRTIPEVTVSKTDATCGLDNGSITFTFPDHPNRTNIEFSIDGGITYSYNVSDNIGSTTISLLAANTYDLWVRWGNNQCPVNLTDVTIVNECIDLSLTKEVDNALPKVGDNITFTITLTNEGPSLATGVEVTDYTLPSTMTLEYVSHTTYGTSTYDEATGIWDLSSETIPLNTPIQLTITVNVVAAGQITNTAEVTKSDQIDIDSIEGNNN